MKKTYNFNGKIFDDQDLNIGPEWNKRKIRPESLMNPHRFEDLYFKLYDPSLMEYSR